MPKESFQISALILVVTCSLLLLSCSRSTTPNFGSLSAQVVLLGDNGIAIDDVSEYSSVFAGLFRYTDSDTTIVRILAEHPNIGANHYFDSAFDHREHLPLSTVQVGSDGLLRLKSITPGHYTLVIIKEGYGVEYLTFNVIGSNEYDLGIIELRPIIEVSGAYMDIIEFETSRQYLVVDDASFLASVVFHWGTKIYVNPAASLRFYGTVADRVEGTESHWLLTSSYGIWSFNHAPSGVSEYAGSNVFYTDAFELSNGKLTYTNNSVVVYSDEAVLSNFLIDRFGTGITFQNSSAAVFNSILNNGLSTGISAIGDDHSFELSKSIIANQLDGINVYVFGGYNINNSYFVDNTYAIRPDRCVGIVSHNCFDRNRYDVFQYQTRGPTEITYNNFYYSRAWSIFPRREAVINNNNFFSTDGYFIWIRSVGAPPYSYVDNDIDATNNYWLPADIDPYIQDANDNHEFPGENCPHYVLYQPRRANKIPSAGIIN